MLYCIVLLAKAWTLLGVLCCTVLYCWPGPGHYWGCCTVLYCTACKGLGTTWGDVVYCTIQLARTWAQLGGAMMYCTVVLALGLALVGVLCCPLMYC